MRKIHRDTLEQWLDEQRDVTLVEVLAPDKYREFHLPGAIRGGAGPGSAGLVYCYDQACTASPTAAHKMDDLGIAKLRGRQDGGGIAFSIAFISMSSLCGLNAKISGSCSSLGGHVYWWPRSQRSRPQSS